MSDLPDGRMVSDTIDVPINAPVVYLTRDVWSDGVPVDGVDVWIAQPRLAPDTAPSHVGHTWLVGAHDGFLGTFSDAAVRARFGVVPADAECIVIDNPRVN